MHNLDPSVKTVWGFSAFFRTLMFTGIALTAEIFVRSYDSVSLPLFWGIPTVVFFFFMLLFQFSLIPLRYKFYSFDVRDRELWLRRGIVTTVETVAPFGRIQHIDVAQSLIERGVGLSRLIVHTAGQHGASIIVPGLPLEYAEQLRNHLKQFAHAVDDV